MGKQKFTIIGLFDEKPAFTEKQLELISNCRYFAGGERHFQLVKGKLPPQYEWESITAPLKNLFKRIKESPAHWVVFASGDPWFFGIANTLKREFPHAGIEVFPQSNSLQLLGHRFGLNYGEYKIISLTGRPWQEFDKALISGEKKIAVLTDHKKTPATIADRMLTYGYSNYKMFYGEHLCGKDEKTLILTLIEALKPDFNRPNCFFLEKTDSKIPKKFIQEKDFLLLNNRPKMITKMPVRLSTLASMGLGSKSVFWDIGACTGSVSIEARLNFPHLNIIAFELLRERREVMEKNCRNFQCPGIQLFGGDYLSIKKETIEMPDAVFLGGHNGKMEEILDDVSGRLRFNGVIAFNSVTETSKERFLYWTKNNPFDVIFQHLIRVDGHNSIQIITIVKNKD